MIPGISVNKHSENDKTYNMIKDEDDKDIATKMSASNDKTKINILNGNIQIKKNWSCLLLTR